MGHSLKDNFYFQKPRHDRVGESESHGQCKSSLIYHIYLDRGQSIHNDDDGNHINQAWLTLILIRCRMPRSGEYRERKKNKKKPPMENRQGDTHRNPHLIEKTSNIYIPPFTTTFFVKIAQGCTHLPSRRKKSALPKLFQLFLYSYLPSPPSSSVLYRERRASKKGGERVRRRKRMR